jgi:hypothetical protein
MLKNLNQQTFKTQLGVNQIDEVDIEFFINFIN